MARPNIFDEINLKAQRPEVQAKLRQLIGIFESLSPAEQNFIINKLITNKKPE